MQGMNSDGLHEILIRAARSESIEAAVPEGFAERVMRTVRTVRTLHSEDPLECWACGLWRAALSSAGFAAVVGAAAVVLVFLEDRTGGLPGSWGFRGDAWNGGGDEIAQALIDGLESGDLQ